MVNNYAIIDADNKAVNFIVWDGVSAYAPPEGCTLVLIPEGVTYGYGWTWNGAVFEQPDPPAPVVPDSITRRQCAMMMFSLQMISGPEAIAMTQTGTPPYAVQQYLDTLPEPQRTFAIMDFAATNYFRDNPLLFSLMTINNMTEQQVDEFFVGAAQL